MYTLLTSSIISER